MPSVLSVWRRNSPLNGPTPPRAFVDIGARVMDSTPHAIARSYAPAITPCATKCAACCDEPHCRSTLVAGTCHGQPGRDPGVAGHVAALLARLGDATADDVVDEAGVDVDALEQPRIVNPSRSVGCHPASAPLRLPIGGAHGVDDDGFAGFHGVLSSVVAAT